MSKLKTDNIDSGIRGNNHFYVQNIDGVAAFSTDLSVKITAGRYHSLVIDIENSAWSWGYNGSGQLGDGTTSDKSSPGSVIGGHSFIDIAGGGYRYSLAVKENGEVWSWGRNGHGQLGVKDTTDYSSPVQVVKTFN